MLRDLVLQTTDSSAVDAHLLGLSNKHVLSVNMFDRSLLNDVFDLAQIFKGKVARKRPLDDILRGKIMASVFYEVSTRTSGSFAAAMKRLGGDVIELNESSSSMKKGETLEDSIAVLAGYADVVVLRHPEPGAVAVSGFLVDIFTFFCILCICSAMSEQFITKAFDIWEYPRTLKRKNIDQ